MKGKKYAPRSDQNVRPFRHGHRPLRPNDDLMNLDFEARNCRDWIAKQGCRAEGLQEFVWGSKPQKGTKLTKQIVNFVPFVAS
jgi:hypothetical protein